MAAAINRPVFFTLLLIVLLCGAFGARAQVIQPTCGPPATAAKPDSMNPHTSFGCRNTGIPGASKFHRGTDYGCGSGSPLKAGATGSMTCRSRSDGDGAGNRCAITIGKCMVLKYFHMDDPGFVAGTRPVVVNQPIGISGASGKNKRTRWGAHLHFEMWLFGKPISAQYFFSKYTGVDVCSDQAARKDLWDHSDRDMAACPGEPNSGPSGGITPPDPNNPDAEISEEGDDACSNDEDIVPDPTAPPDAPTGPQPPVTPGSVPWQPWTTPSNPNVPGGNQGPAGPLGPWVPTTP